VNLRKAIITSQNKRAVIYPLDEKKGYGPFLDAGGIGFVYNGEIVSILQEFYGLYWEILVVHGKMQGLHGWVRWAKATFVPYSPPAPIPIE
jgi:hypothetical protein